MSDLTEMGFAFAPVRPLPVGVKRFEYESMDSFIRRLAAANGADVRVVETWLIQQGSLSPVFDREHWFQVWLHLAGNLQNGPHQVLPVASGAATAPGVDRPLCRRCSHGDYASGDLTRLGLVCLRHRVWIDPHDGVHADEESIRAERRFRKNLMKRNLSLWSPEMRFARRLVLLTVTPAWMEAHRGSHGRLSAYSAAYAAQVAIAVDLFERHELAALASDPGAHSLVGCTDWLRKRIDRLSAADEPWRAGAVLSQLIHFLDHRDTLPHVGDPALTDILERLSR